MKLSILALFSLWLTVAAACAAETPVPTPTPTPTPTIEPPLKENLEPLIAYPDIGYQQADLKKWLKVIQEIGLEQHPGVTRIYTATDSGGYGNIRIIVSSREHIGPVMEQVELAGVPFNIAQVLLDSPWHR